MEFSSQPRDHQHGRHDVRHKPTIGYFKIPNPLTFKTEAMHMTFHAKKSQKV